MYKTPFSKSGVDLPHETSDSTTLSFHKTDGGIIEADLVVWQSTRVEACDVDSNKQ